MISFTRTQHIAIGLLLFVLVALSGVSLYSLRAVEDTVMKHLVEQQQVAHIFSDVAVAFIHTGLKFKDLESGIVTDTDLVADELNYIRDLIAKLRQVQHQTQEDFTSEIDVIEGEAHRFRTAYVAFNASMQEDPTRDYATNAFAQIHGIINQSIENVMAQRALHVESQKQIIASLLGSVRRSFVVLLVIICIGVTCAVVTGLWLTRQLDLSVKNIIGVTQKIGGGDLGIRLKTKHRDSLGQLCDGIDQMGERLAQTSEQTKQALEAAEAGSRAKSEFLANMSHEIRTPMTAILGYAELLDTEGEIASDPRRAAETISVIRNNANHLLTIINDILDMSKIEAGKMTVESVVMSPVQIVEEVVSLMGARAKGKGLEVRVRYDTEIPEKIQSDPTRLRQILMNLVSNGLKFTELGSVTIHVSCVKENGNPKIKFAVVDTGVGMTAAQRDVIASFKAFSQADNSTTRKFGGTGLGLRISNSLALLLGQGIEIESVPDVGSTFTVTIDSGDLTNIEMVNPEQVASLHASKAKKVDKKPAISVPQVSLSGLRILLAEDGPDNQRLISFHLKKAGASVDIADNGRVAVEKINAAIESNEPYDVVLMDMQMPELDGYGAARQLRHDGYDGPIIALTAHAMDSDRKKCIDAGCDDYQTKPINKTILISACATWSDGRKHVA